MQFGAEQADAGGARLGKLRQVDGKACVHQQVDLHAVLGQRRLLAQLAIDFLPAGPESDLFRIGRLEIGLRSQMDGAFLAVDDDGIAVFRHGNGALHLAGDGDPHGARHDDDVAGRRAVLQHHAAQLVAGIVEQLGRAHRAGDDDGVLGQRGRDILRSAPHQLAQQPVREVVEVAHPLAQIGIGHVQHAGAHVALHLLHRRLGRQAVADRLLQPPHPAAIVGEHAIGFQHLAMLTLEGDVAALQHVVDGEPERAERGLQPADLLLAVLVEQVGDDDTRLVQHDMAEADTVIEGQAGEADRAPQVEFQARPREPREITGGDHLGDHHRRGFQRLDLVVAIVAHGLVLHDQDAERAPCPEHRHAEEGVVDLLAGFWQVGEGGVFLRVGKVERPRAGGDGADQALSESQLREVDGVRVQTFGGIELQHRVGAQHVERANFGDHVGGDVAHDPVEPLLRLQRLLHEFAEPFQQNARAAGRITHHGFISNGF